MLSTLRLNAVKLIVVMAIVMAANKGLTLFVQKCAATKLDTTTTTPTRLKTVLFITDVPAK